MKSSTTIRNVWEVIGVKMIEMTIDCSRQWSLTVHGDRQGANRLRKINR